jgi:hypothetical protein
VYSAKNATGFLVFFFLLLLAILLSWPAATHLTTYVPGDGGDDPALVWNLWWVKYALLNSGQTPFLTNIMFYPIGVNLAFYTLTVLNGLTALPVTLLAGVVTASNLHTLFSFVVGGYGAFLLVFYLLGTAGNSKQTVLLSATLAGMIYAFASNKWFYVALGQFNIASTHWIPFAVLYTIRAHRNPGQLKNPLLAGLFIVLQTWSEMTYTSFLVVFLAIYWAFIFIREWHHWKNHLQNMVTIGLTVSLGISPILAYMVSTMRKEGDFLLEGSGFAGAFSADLLGFFIPTMHHPFLGHLISQTNITNYDKGQHIYIGYSLLLLAILGIIGGWHRREVRFWIVASTLFGLLTLGPVITVNGHESGIPGPFVLFQQLPLFKANRYPSRYSVMFILTLSVLAAYGFFWISRYMTRTRLQVIVAAGLGLLFLFEHLSAPLPQSDMRVPHAYQVIADSPEQTTVLDIPFAWRNGFRIIGPLTTEFMFGQFYQTSHQKPLLQGNTSRNPFLTFHYFARAPVINSLLALQTGKTISSEQQAIDQTIGADVLHFFNIGYIVVRPDFTGNPAVTPQATIGYIENYLPVEKIYNQETAVVYRVTSPDPTQKTHITPDSPLAPLYFGEGWGLVSDRTASFSIQRPLARLMLPLTPVRRQVSMRLRLPAALASQTERQVRVELNGWQSAYQTITPAWQEFTFTLPAGTIHPGVNNLYLRFKETEPLPLTPLVDVSVISAGEDVGGVGLIYLNGRNISPNERGYNIAIIDTAGDVEVAGFDTHLSPDASEAMADFLTAAPPDATIAVAAADEASANLTETAVLALKQTTGATTDLRDCFRCSHAIIYYNRETIEQASPIHPLEISTALGVTEPAITAQMAWFELKAVSD